MPEVARGEARGRGKSRRRGQRQWCTSGRPGARGECQAAEGVVGVGVRTPGVCFHRCCSRVFGVGPVHSQRDGGSSAPGQGHLRSWLRCRAGTLDPAEQSPGLGPHHHPALARSGQARFSDLASE